MSKDQKGTRMGRGGFLGKLFIFGLLAVGGFFGYEYYQKWQETQVLKQMISRLTADRKVADVWVKEYKRGSDGQPQKVVLKILEKDAEGNPLSPVLCPFSLSDIIHFEALVIRLSDELVMNGEGKSIHLFRRAYALEEGGKTYESCEISAPMQVPRGYALDSDDPRVSKIERTYWKLFWEYALDSRSREKAGVKNAQIEAPATRFVPDTIYRIILEHDGGLRIEATAVPDILKGEKVS